MNKYAIVTLPDYSSLEFYRYLFRYKELGKESSFGYPKILEPILIKTDNPREEKRQTPLTVSIYLSGKRDKDILFEAETDEEALLFYEVCDK